MMIITWKAVTLNLTPVWLVLGSWQSTPWRIKSENKAGKDMIAFESWSNQTWFDTKVSKIDGLVFSVQLRTPMPWLSAVWYLFKSTCLRIYGMKNALLPNISLSWNLNTFLLLYSAKPDFHIIFLFSKILLFSS